MNRLRRAAVVVLPVLALALPAAGARAEEGVACGAPPELLEPGAPLPAAARAVESGSLRILVVGSASVLGRGTSGPAAAWPARLEALLAERFPGLKVDTVVRGTPGTTAAESAAVIAEELRRAPPALVVWQTGAVEAARGLDLDEMAATLDAGLGRVEAVGADAALVDPQFSRFLRANANVEPYREAMRLAAAAHGALLVPRYDLMHAWAEAEKVDLERALPSARVAVADRLNDCLARAVAVLLARGIAEANPTAAARP